MLGLDENEIVALYEHSKQQLGEPSLVPNSRLEMAPVRGKPRWPWVVGGAATLFIASALVAYLSEHGLPWVDQIPEESVATPVLQEAPGATTQAPAATTQAPVPTTQAPAAAASAPSIAGPAGIASDATAATTSSALQSGQVSLSVKFTADSWIEVFDGSGKAVLYDLGKGGTERTLTATAPLSVTIGDGAAVVVTVNGRVLPVLPRAQGQALARFSIGPDGSLR
jgi:cytoskeletal protein RodZ